MKEAISIEEAERDLRGLLLSLRDSESVTVLDEEGTPVAALTGLKSEAKKATTQAEGASAVKGMSIDEWLEGMERLAKEVDAAWKGDKSGLDELRESRERLD